MPNRRSSNTRIGPAVAPSLDAPAFHGDTVLTGARVRLRPFDERDLDALWEGLNEPEGRRLTGTHTEFTRDASDRWYRSRGAASDRLDLAIADVGQDRCVGEVALMDLDPDNRACSFRIALARPDLYGRGYGTDAIRLVLDHVFGDVGLHRVDLEVYAFNQRARHVYERIGFTIEGTKRDALFQAGRFHDAILMAMLAPEWARA